MLRKSLECPRFSSPFVRLLLNYSLMSVMVSTTALFSGFVLHFGFMRCLCKHQCIHLLIISITLQLVNAFGNIELTMYITIQFGVSKNFEKFLKSLICLPRLHLFDKIYIKNNNIMN